MTTQPNLQVNEELAQAIVTLYQTQDQAQRQTVHEQLINLQQDIEKHAWDVFALIIDATNPVVQEHKKSFAIYLKNFFDQLLRDFMSSFGGQPVSTQQIQQRIYVFSEMLLQTFLSPTLQLHIKANFSSVLARFVRMSKNLDNEANKPVHSNYLNTLIIPIVQGLQSNQFETQCGAISFCESLLRNLTLDNVDQGFLAISQALCQVAELHLTALKNDFAQIQQQIANKEEIPSTNPTADSMTQHMKVLQSWVAMHKRLLDSDDESTMLLFLRFSRSEVYSSQMTLLLSLSALDTPEHTASIISFTGLQKLDQMINQIKTDNIICINRLLQFVYTKVSSAQRKNVPFIPKMVQFVNPLVNSLSLVTKRPDLEAICEEEIYADIIIEMLAMLVIFSGEKEFYDVVQSNFKPILISICLNFLKTMKSEFETIEDNPQDFVNLALDTCDKQQSETIKTNAAKLLESMCDNIDGAVSNITIFCCAAINTALQGAPVQPSQLLDMQSDPFLHNQPEIIVETCIIAMTVISYILPRRKDLVPIFEETLSTNIDKILSQDNILLRVRLSLLLGYYADMLFTKQPEAFKKSMTFLFSSVGLESKRDHVIALQSCDTLNTIVQDDDLMPRLAEMLPEIVQTINGLIASVKVVNFFEFVQEFIKMYRQLLAEQHIITIIQSLVMRVVNEQKGESENKLPIINKSWNCIRAIVEIDAYIKPHYGVLEESLKPLFEFMVNVNQISFDEDIVLIIKSFIKKSKSVSPTLWTLFPLLRNIFDKNKHCLGNLLDTINFYLVYGAETISQNKEYIQNLLSIAATSLFTEQENQTLNNSEGAILLQLMLQILQNYDCLNDFFAEMLDGVVKRMQAKPMVKHLKRQLLGIFMAAMIYNTDATINYMEQKNITTEVVTELINIKLDCQTIYERKLMVCGMTKLVSCSVLPESMRPLIGRVIQQIIQTLLQQKKIEAKQQRQRAIKEVKIQHEDDDEESDEEDDDDEDEDDSDLEEETNNQGDDEKMEDDKKEGGDDTLGFTNADNEDAEEIKDADSFDMDEVFDLNVSLDMLNTPIKKEDEFKLFGSTIKQIHQRSPQDFGQIVQCFTDSDKEFCKQLLQHQRIELVVNGQQQQVARRIIKVKRNTAK